MPAPKPDPTEPTAEDIATAGRALTEVRKELLGVIAHTFITQLGFSRKRVTRGLRLALDQLQALDRDALEAIFTEDNAA